MTKSSNPRDIVLIYDGECDFCKESVKWLQRKLQVTALPFQKADLARYNLTYERCSKEVIAIKDEKIFGGADAIALLLKVRGNRVLATLVSLSGPLGRRGYRWVAAHRDGLLVKVLVKIFTKFTATV